MKLFIGCSEIEFVHEIMNKQVYANTQQGFDRLAHNINARCNLFVKLYYLSKVDLVKVLILSGDENRTYRTVIRNEDVVSSFLKIEDILTAFACGLGYEY